MFRAASLLLLTLTLTLTLAPAALGAGFDSTQLERLIQARNFTSAQQAIEALPRDLLGNFTLIYESLSIQDASFVAPRVVLFGEDGKFLLTFNGDSSQRGYDTLEALEFNDASSRYHTARFFFSRPPVSAPTARRIPGTATAYVERDSKVCAACHGETTTHPIFAPYNVWPGFYGSHDDQLKYAMGDEREGFASFLSEGRKLGPYASLIFPEGSETSPYGDGYDHRFRPNLRFGKFVLRNTARSISRTIRESRHYPELRAWLAFQLLACERSEIPDVVYERWRERVSALLRATSGRKADPVDPFGQTLAVLGVDVDAWTLGFRAQSYFAYSDGYHSMLDFVARPVMEDLALAVKDSPYPIDLDPSGGKFAQLYNVLGIAIDRGAARKACPILANLLAREQG